MASLTESAEIEELGTGQFRHTQYMKPVAYRENGTLRVMAQDWEDSGDGTRPHKVDRAPVMVTAGEDGMRRIHPTRELDRYIEIGAPFVKTGGVWGKVNLGTPTRNGLRLQWTRPQANMYVDFGGHFVKLSILLKGGFVPEDSQIAFPVGMSGFTRQGLNLLRDGEVIARLDPPIMVDFADSTDRRPIAHQIINVNGEPHWLMTLPDLTGMAQPVIDPTITLQPNATDGYDTYIVQQSPTVNSESDTNLFIGETSSGTQTIRTLIKFNLSTIPDAAIISSAIFSLFCTADQSSNARTFRMYRVKRVWIDTQATWNIYSTGNNWQVAGATGTDDVETPEITSRAFTATETINQFKDWVLPSIPPTTKAALDLGNGWMLKADVETNDRYVFASSDNATAANRPKFEVIYTLPPTPVKFAFYQRLRR